MQVTIAALFMLNSKGIIERLFPEAHAATAWVTLIMTFLVAGVALPCAAMRQFEQSSRREFLFKQRRLTGY